MICTLYQNFITIFKSCKMQCGGQVPHEMRNTYRILFSEHEGEKNYLGNLDTNLRIIIMMGFCEQGDELFEFHRKQGIWESSHISKVK